MSQYGYISHSELAHHGVKGQKWGVRRYQNADGSLTPEGKRKYGNLKNFYNAQAAKKAKLKRAAIIGGSIAGVAALGTGAAIAGHKIYENRKHQKAWDKIHQVIREDHARQDYAKQNSIVEGIKNNPNAHHQGNQRAQALLNNRNIERIKNNRKAHKSGDTYAKAVRTTPASQNVLFNQAVNRINSNPNVLHQGNQRAQALLNDRNIERIKKNKNAYHAGNKYAKQPGQ